MLTLHRLKLVASFGFCATLSSLIPTSIVHGQNEETERVANRNSNPEPPTETVPFRVLDRVLGPDVNLNAVPFSPIAHSADGNFLAVVNPHGNMVRLFDTSASKPAGWKLLSSHRTAWGPTSCGFLERSNQTPQLLVTCANSDALILFDLDGRIDGLVSTPSEPSDLLIDQSRSIAWVSCLAADVVVEIDLQRMQVAATYPIPSKHPAFLAFEHGHSGTVIVAPMISGNNTTIDRGESIFNAGPRGILDLATAVRGLPDQDLFRLNPSDASVNPIVTGAGAILFDHGRNPITGAWWMLGTDANNFAFQSEPMARARFNENRVTLIDALPGEGQAAIKASQSIDLDDGDREAPGVQFDRNRTVGQPYSLAFDDNGNGFITGMLTDNVTQLDASGEFVREWNVGSIPRGLSLIDKAGISYLAVYCWGSNQLEIYAPLLGTERIASLDVGPDPMSATIQAGRALYYSAKFSADNNTSCNTCHIDGFTDLLPWDLSDRRIDSEGNYTVALDDKGPLITQSLRSIKGRNPYHWRGERDRLVDFNVAFPGLLGGRPLYTSAGDEFDKFEAFVFSLQERANPHESPHRRVDDDLVADSFPDGTSAVRGQTVYFEKEALESSTCQSCHSLPGGTLNSTFRDEVRAPIAERSHFANPALLSLWRRLQSDLVEIEYRDGRTDIQTTLGVGLAATGLAKDVKDFVSQLGSNLDEQELQDVAAYVMQLDSGLAPLAHTTVRLGKSDPSNSAQSFDRSNASTTTWTDTAKLELLLDRAPQDDLQLLAVVDFRNRALHGLFNHGKAQFEFTASDGSAVELGLPDFRAAIDSGDLTGFVYPLPDGLAQRFNELDGNPTVQIGTPAVASPKIQDFDVVFASASVAKLIFYTEAPTTIRIECTPTIGDPRIHTESVPTRYHTIFIRDLAASMDWDVRVQATGVNDASDELVIAKAFRTMDLVIPSHVIASSLSAGAPIRDSGGVLRFVVDIAINRLNGVPGYRYTPTFDVLVRDASSGSWREIYMNFASPRTDVKGHSSTEFEVMGLEVYDEVHVRIDGILASDSDFYAWSTPDTQPENRIVSVTYTGKGP